MSELAARAHRAVLNWCARPDEEHLAPMAPLDVASVLLVPIVMLAFMAAVAA